MNPSDINRYRRQASRDFNQEAFIKAGVHLLLGEMTINELKAKVRYNYKYLSELIGQYRHCFYLEARLAENEKESTADNTYIELTDNGKTVLQTLLLQTLPL